LAGHTVLTHLGDGLSSDSDEKGDRNGAGQGPTMLGYRPHHQPTNVEKEQTGN
jgi:hypothetical protein